MLQLMVIYFDLFSISGIQSTELENSAIGFISIIVYFAEIYEATNVWIPMVDERHRFWDTIRSRPFWR